MGERECCLWPVELRVGPRVLGGRLEGRRLLPTPESAVGTSCRHCLLSCGWRLEGHKLCRPPITSLSLQDTATRTLLPASAHQTPHTAASQRRLMPCKARRWPGVWADALCPGLCLCLPGQCHACLALIHSPADSLSLPRPSPRVQAAGRSSGGAPWACSASPTRRQTGATPPGAQWTQRTCLAPRAGAWLLSPRSSVTATWTVGGDWGVAGCLPAAACMAC